MLSKIVAWFGKEFMLGSGYEKRLHKSLEELNQKVDKTNRILTSIATEIHLWRSYHKN